jgi:hypothetical protein
MEAAVMSLNGREQQALDSIADGLSGTDPKLASLLATFTQLTAGEKMPVPEKIRPAGRWATRLRHRPRRGKVRGGARRPRQQLGSQAAVLLWLLISVALIAVALPLNRGGGNGTCAVSWPPACAAEVPAHATSPGRRTEMPAARQEDASVHHPYRFRRGR